MYRKKNEPQIKTFNPCEPRAMSFRPAIQENWWEWLVYFPINPLKPGVQ